MAESEQDGNPVKADSADDDTDEESEVLEESPCGRWQKRREEVCYFEEITRIAFTKLDRF